MKYPGTEHYKSVTFHGTHSSRNLLKYRENLISIFVPLNLFIEFETFLSKKISTYIKVEALNNSHLIYKKKNMNLSHSSAKYSKNLKKKSLSNSD
jgi:tRNA G18 (ribose-2'-O)-methylase SpoU